MLLAELTTKTILDWINTGGTVGLLALIIVSGSRKWWVFGWYYKELEDRFKKVEESNTMWMQLALRGVNVTEQIVKTVTSDDGIKQT